MVKIFFFKKKTGGKHIVSVAAGQSVWGVGGITSCHWCVERSSDSWSHFGSSSKISERIPDWIFLSQPNLNSSSSLFFHTPPSCNNEENGDVHNHKWWTRLPVFWHNLCCPSPPNPPCWGVVKSHIYHIDRTLATRVLQWPDSVTWGRVTLRAWRKICRLFSSYLLKQDKYCFWIQLHLYGFRREAKGRK